MSAGGGSSNAGNYSSQHSNANQSVWAPQGDALQGLYGAAQNMYQNQPYTSAIDSMMGGLSSQLGGIAGQAQGGYQNMLGGGSVGNTDDIRNQLMQSLTASSSSPSNTSQMYQSIVGGAGNTYIDPMVAAMKTGAMDNLARLQAGTGLDAAAMGQAGGSRQAMQNAMLGSQANKDMMAQEAMMRGGAYDKDLAMKMNIAALADQNVAGSQDKMMSLLGMADQNVGAGMNFGSAMQGLGMGALAPFLQGQQASMNALNNYSDVIGGPTVLGSASGDGRSFGTSQGANASAGKK